MSIKPEPGRQMIAELLKIDLNQEDFIVALAGNPNTGKSTVFNSLTGLNQHTGNWPGKTVTTARGKYVHNDKTFILVDLPGTYSLSANSVDEEIARDFICSGVPHVTVVVADATCLERNLILVLQVLEITNQVVLCVNLLDEAKRKGIQVDLPRLSEMLGIPVIGTNARDGVGLKDLKDAIDRVARKGMTLTPIVAEYGDEIEKQLRFLQPDIQKYVKNGVNSRWITLSLLEKDPGSMECGANDTFFKEALPQELTDSLYLVRQSLQQHYPDPERLHDHIVAGIVNRAEGIAKEAIFCKKADYNDLDRRIDSVLTSKIWGIPVMLTLLGMVFWITIKGANYPSQALASGFFWLEERLTHFFLYAGWPGWLHGLLVSGMYKTLAWVVSVMLPPMAIFFPLFTLLEDLGYLPRIAFNLDNYFQKACAHGKQALTMCMGFGCNAAGVIACRIIDSPRERLIAIITNNFVPCNGRFPTLIALATIFIAGGMAGHYQSLVASLSILAVIVLGVVVTLAVSWLLSKTILKGLPSSFTLELPPYRKPQLGRIIVRSIYDRTLFVLGRAVIVAAPAGMITWALANISVGELSILQHGVNYLDPFAQWLGLDGFILMAFILGLPANEIVIPILIMSYMSTGQMIELDSLQALRELFVAHGWTWLTAVCTMLFCLNHFPCGTTLLTIQKETQSLKWTGVTFLVTTATGLILCFLVAQSARLLGLA
ncbi:Ferrous iron transport protein B [Syntrophomonas zehnderi OL-4]|uniref:Ferrous iron transport protein B n=2 Tax=Syntrophomonas TaxID=862 RepID=A0A0E4G9M7_9FIRM|nr:Ferrous iron transport protein B [Syntrophomonas zehnderi OL-4]